MKKHLLSMLLATIWLCSLAQIPTNGLVEQFTFNNTLTGSAGTVLGTTQANYVADRLSAPSSAQNLVNSVYSFSGVSIPNLPTGNTDRTVCFWYKSNANTTHSLFNYGNGGSNTFAIAYVSSPDRIVMFNGSAEYSSNTAYTGNWTHIAVVHSGGNTSVYANGVQLGTATAITYNTTNGQTTNIGFSPGGGSFPGFQMDDLLIYNRALTAQEVTNVYNACSGPANTTPAANMNICAGSSTTLSMAGSNVSWYNASSGGPVLASTNSFTTPVLNINTTYYAATASCTTRTAVPVTVARLCLMHL